MAVGYVILSAIAVIAIDLRIVLIPTACTVLALVACGFLVFRPLKVGLAIPWPASLDSDDQSPVITINGTPCPFQGYEQELCVEIRPRRLTELFVGCALAAATLYVTLSVVGTIKNDVPIGPFDAELICIAGLALLLRSLRWFNERLFLRSSRFTIGTILGVDPGFFHRGATYQFFDQNRERRGGTGPLSSDHDNAVLVLYRPNDPDVNATNGAFAFHRFRIGLMPGRRRPAVAAGITR